MRRLSFICLSALMSLPALAADLPDFTDLIQKTSPAVVKINTVSASPAAYNGRDDIPDSLRQFFDYYQYQQPPQDQAQAVGAGFILSADGYVLTNNHVVEGAAEITVRLNDRHEYRAEVVGVDPQSDLALLKVDAEGLPTVAFADPDSLEVGDWVVAIGSPFNLDYSASAGIVSAIGRSLPNGSGQDYVPFIQTDVAINPGNSGGPLFNLDGEVVGINSQIFTRSGGYMGLSFAIPVSVAMDVVDQLKATGQVTRGWLGVVIQEVDQELAESFGLDRPRGALINQVAPNSPASRADLRPGDVVLSFDGQPITYSYELPHVVGLRAPGSSYPVRLMRRGEEIEIEVRVGELGGAIEPSRVSSSKQPIAPGAPIAPSALGMRVEELDARSAAQLQLNGGVVVRAVQPDSPASRAGLAPGDIIVQLGFRNIGSMADFDQAIVDAASDERMPIRYFRNGNSVFRTIKVD